MLLINTSSIQIITESFSSSIMPSRFLFPLRRNRQRATDMSVSDVPTSDPFSSDSHVRQRPSDEHTRNRGRHYHPEHDNHPRRHVKSLEPRQLRIQSFRLKAIDKGNDECSVCAKAFEIDCIVSLVACGHYFCQECAVQWFGRKHSTTCPLCRYDVAAASSRTTKSQQEEECPAAPEAIRRLATIQVANTTGKNAVSSFVETKARHAAAISNNFELIMAKTLHARRAMLMDMRQTGSWGSSSFSELDDNDY
jgi:hypothetical protein